MHMLGMHGTAFANYAVEDCDFIIAVGARFDDRVAGVPAKFAPNARAIAHIDIDRAEISKVKRVQWSHVGLLPDALTTLIAYGRTHYLRAPLALSAWHKHLAELKSRHAMNYDRNSLLIQPYYVIEEINKRHARPGDRHDRRGTASDVGRTVFRFLRTAPMVDLGQHGHHGFWLAGGDWCAIRES